MRLQTEDQSEPLESLLAKANAEALEKKQPAQTVDLSRLDSMGLDELKTLVRRVCGGKLAIALMTKTEIAEAMMYRLACKALDPEGRETLAAINQWLDREKGRAVTPIAAQIVVKDEKPVDKRELARKIDFLMSMAENEAETPAIMQIEKQPVS